MAPRAPELRRGHAHDAAERVREVAPREVRIRPGQVVVWVNEDPPVHTATGEGWDSGMLEEGERFARRFDAVGEYPYRCTPHPPSHRIRGCVRAESCICMRP